MKIVLEKSKNCSWRNEEWYKELNSGAKVIADLIHKYHNYFSFQDKKYRNVVSALKITVLLLAMGSTIILGLKTIIDINSQLVIGLILSALITFVTAITSYFNYEEYWMRNISIHIKLNIIRDNFVYEAECGELDENRVKYYKTELEKLQKKNIKYWGKAIKRA